MSNRLIHFGKIKIVQIIYFPCFCSPLPLSFPLTSISFLSFLSPPYFYFSLYPLLTSLPLSPPPLSPLSSHYFQSYLYTFLPFSSDIYLAPKFLYFSCNFTFIFFFCSIFLISKFSILAALKGFRKNVGSYQLKEFFSTASTHRYVLVRYVGIICTNLK